MKNKKSSILFVILISVVFVFLFLIGLSSVFLYTTYNKSIESQASLVDTKLKAIKNHSESVLYETEQIFDFLIQDIISLKGVSSLSLSEKVEMLAKTYLTITSSVRVSILDELGTIIATSGDQSRVDMETMRNVFLNDVSELKDGEVGFISPEKSFFDSKFTFCVVKSVSSSEFGQKIYTVVEVDVLKLEHKQEAIASGVEGIFVVLTSEGIPLIKTGDARTSYEKESFYNQEIIGKLNERQKGSFVMKAKKSKPSFFSYEWLDNYPLVVVSEYLGYESTAGWQRTTIIYFGFLAFLMVLLIILTLVIVNQFTQLKLLNEDLSDKKTALEYLVLQDPLTGVANRASCIDRLTNLLEISKRYGNQYVGVLYIGINRFKDINERYGYKVGDEILKSFAQRLVKKLRISDTVSRMGGDEFLVVAPQISTVTQLKRIMEKIHVYMQEPFFVKNLSVVVSISVGYSISIRPSSSSDSMVTEAEKAMNESKPTESSE